MVSSRQPLLSVISVTYEDEAGIRRTLASLERLATATPGEVECIVKDGGTQGGLASVVHDYPWAQFLVGKDRGTYDAMNIGLDKSQGKYVWFLNGGDEAAIDSWFGLRELLLGRDTVLLFDYFRVGNGSVEYRRSKSPSYIWHALPTSHQAIFYPGSVARQHAYNTSYPVAADYEYTAQVLKGGARAERTGIAVARFYLGGLSTRRQTQVAVDASRVQRSVLRTSPFLRAVSRARHFLVFVVMRAREWPIQRPLGPRAAR